MSLLSLLSDKKELSPVNDPFKKDCLKSVHAHVMKFYDGTFSFTGSIEFKNGDTEGTQKFSADDFGSLIQKMESFIKTL